jgi:hypothetical protein
MTTMTMARTAVAGALVISALAAGAVAAAPAQAGSRIAAAWRTQFPPVPSGTLSSGLGSVSCSSATACAATGNFEGPGSNFVTFTEIWNGHHWSYLAIPGGDAASLNGVWCRAAKDCLAVGDVVSGSGLVPLVEHYNGTKWAAEKTADPADADRAFLTAVSCSGSSACTAVGFYINQQGNTHGLAERWNGSRWRLQTLPHPAGATSVQLNGVACPATNACRAVGSDPTGTFAESWNGTTWKIRPTLLLSGGRNGFLSAVSCTSASACTATGDYVAGQREVPLAERWNGSSWTPQHPPAPSRGRPGGLIGVSCASATSCSAVGFQGKSIASTHGLAEHWNGHQWSTQGVAAPAGGREYSLGAVSCPAPAVCEAAGFAAIANGDDRNLAERYS